jgi:hypothetical protein
MEQIKNIVIIFKIVDLIVLKPIGMLCVMPEPDPDPRQFLGWKRKRSNSMRLRNTLALHKTIFFLSTS